MSVNQSSFRAALLDAAAPAPQGLQDATGAPAGRRYDVYRNNVVVSLTEAMKLAFPTVRALVGPENFDSLAPLFVRQHPPSSPLMMHYGADFPAFLEAFTPLAHLGYLGDVARFDLARRACYHAADAVPFDAAVLQRPPEVLGNLHLVCAPATRLIRSRWPVFDLWQRATDPTAPAPRPVGQAVLITRPEFDPEVHLLPTGAATWFTTLRTRSLGAAIEAATAAAPDFDFATTLTLALQSHAFCTPERTPE
ncbi:DNA-binding domain-containing protein [Sulfitobacter sp. F26169L]|uniref:HvfC/BufC N-terminal domain-containing protein n=1 Tax=Sulfitobacter sp. F26169L TaxID=2996015 RepID=UPI00226085EE|nr:DNA-binding domain-containing protein [Sulfitobacter sp. F26169L]MCX7564865.1 DNA-binding domain-containing protein [Sulfitobacter sp. F26169L]